MKEGTKIKAQIKLTYTEGYENGYKQAIKDINTPMLGIRVGGEAQCPRCEHYLVEVEQRTDYWRLKESLVARCPYCGQRLKWR